MMPGIVSSTLGLRDDEMGLIMRHAARVGAPLQAILDDAFREGLEILLERIEESELPRDGPETK